MDNPLTSTSDHEWVRLIDSVGPASLLVVIAARMSSKLRQHLEPEDIWQDALLHAWRDRLGFEWRGVQSFRRWLIQIIENRIRDAADRLNAKRRGNDRTVLASSVVGPGGAAFAEIGPAGSTTPSRIASQREQALIMQEALEQLPADLRDVVRLRLFEERSLEEAAADLGIGPAAVKHRFRKAVGIYRTFLRRALAASDCRSGTGQS